MEKQSVYLSGSLDTSNWQEKVEKQLQNKFIFFNPITHNCHRPEEYTTWDLHFVKQCDIIFAYMEKDNPSGYGLTLEIGFALGLNKTVILIDEKSQNDKEFSSFFKIVTSASTIVFDDLEKGINYLAKFSLS